MDKQLQQSSDGRTETVPHVSAIVLNYNTPGHVKTCIEKLIQQDYPFLSIIIVDNASKPSCVEEIENWLADFNPGCLKGSVVDVTAQVKNVAKPHRLMAFVKHDQNGGYGKGNNIGLRLAADLGADAALMVNPDVQISQVDTISILAAQLFNDERNLVVAPRVFDPNGNDQNPLRTRTFRDEVLMPRGPMRLFVKTSPNYLVDAPLDSTSIAEEIHGCCQLVRMQFFEKSGFFDEEFFLYCEEATMTVMVQQHGGRIVYDPSTSVFHNHIVDEKDGPNIGTVRFHESRKLFVSKYSGYPLWQIWFLQGYYTLVNMFLRRRIRHGQR